MAYFDNKVDQQDYSANTNLKTLNESKRESVSEIKSEPNISL